MFQLLNLQKLINPTSTMNIDLFHITPQKSPAMDAIRKKMQSLKAETDTLYATIAKFEEDTREAVKRAEQVIIKIYQHIEHILGDSKSKV
jgi:hypothetical protein